MGRRRSAILRDPVRPVVGWVRRQSIKVKVMLGTITALLFLFIMKAFIHDPNHFFIASEAVHAAGIFVLIRKLTHHNTCAGLSLKFQELSAIFLAARLYCSYVFEKDIHTVLDFAALISTIWVIYMMRFKLKSSYTKELDTMSNIYTIVPCILLSLFIHPYVSDFFNESVLWAFSVYLESVSVLPQLRFMQNAKMVEPFTAHYVFALGVSRLLGCAQWMMGQFVRSKGSFRSRIENRVIWIPFAFLTEIIQTFILTDFCYYYVKSSIKGQQFMKLPSVA